MSRKTARCAQRSGTSRTVHAKAMRRHNVNAVVAHTQPRPEEAFFTDTYRHSGYEAAQPDQLRKADLEHLNRSFSIEYQPSATSERGRLEYGWRQSVCSATASDVASSRRPRSNRTRARARAPAPSTSTGHNKPCTQLTRLEKLERVVSGLEQEAQAGLGRSGVSATSTALIANWIRRVLTKDEEQLLFRCIRKVSVVNDNYVSLEATNAVAVEVAGAYSLSFEQAHRLVLLARRCDKLLHIYNVRLVYSMADRYRKSGVPMGDLIVEGMSGIKAAIGRFDPSRGFKFSSYATWYIRRHLNAALDQKRVILLPRHVEHQAVKLHRERAALLAERPELGQRPEALHAELAAVTDLDADAVKNLLTRSALPTDLDAFADAESGESMIDAFAERLTKIGEHGEEAGEDAIDWDAPEMMLMESSLNAVLQTLEPRQRNILRLRYGINSERRTVHRSVVAKAYGLSTERIRQLEEQAIASLKQPWRQQILKEYNEC